MGIQATTEKVINCHTVTIEFRQNELKRVWRINLFVDDFKMKKICIALGWRCRSAQVGVERGLRGRKIDGYKTCPFDIMISNYHGIIECIAEDFKDFCNLEYLTLAPYGNEIMIKHTKYNFHFNHESPGHNNLYLTENWEFGSNHFVENNFQRFIACYQARINNFRNYLNDPNNEILFIVDRFNSPPI